MKKIFEIIDYGTIETFFDHGTHVVQASLFLDEKRTIEPQSEILACAKAE